MARILKSMISFAALVASQKLAILKERQFCAVSCGQGWCCDIAMKCIPGPSDDAPYQCDDPLLQTTWEAYRSDFFGSISTAIQSIESDVSTFIAGITSEFSITITTTSPLPPASFPPLVTPKSTAEMTTGSSSEPKSTPSYSLGSSTHVDSASSSAPTPGSTGTEDTTSSLITLGAGPAPTRSPTTTTNNAAAGRLVAGDIIRNTGLWSLLLGVLLA